MGRLYQIVGNNTWQHADAVHLIFEIFDGSVGRRMEPPGYLTEGTSELRYLGTQLNYSTHECADVVASVQFW
jgi:hypothetical protein